ncbi:MAG TPA: NAD-dependent protein deacylase [Enhygromyxa sp.]|nr:NAD-dependent protein deacylase [Enhygromyxa sp.]
MDPRQRALVDAVADQLAPLENLLFITGAGISVDSGLPTYRGVGGLYDGVDTEEGLPIEVVLSGPYFQAHPDRCWKYLRQIGDACRGAKPNAAHLRIVELERARARVVTLTQNVDGLHVAAGSQNVIAIHGDANALRCAHQGRACDWSLRVTDYDELAQRFAGQAVPRCPSCGAVVRPDVVLFEELLPEAAVERLQTELRRGFDAVISIGTSALFPYIVAPVLEARRQCKLTVEINPGVTEVSEFVDFHLQLGAAEAMDALVERILGGD